jgi:PAS domain S-box-containing protein
METLMRSLVESTAFAVIAARPDGIVSVFNRAAERLLGYSATEVIGLESPAIWHDAGEVAQRAAELTAELGVVIQPGFEVFVYQAREFNTADDRPWTYVRKDGSRVPVLLSVTALRSAGGEVTGYLGLARDRSELLRMESQVTEQESQLRAVFDASLDAMVVIDERGSVLDLNPAAERLFGYKVSELRGGNVRRIMPDPDASRHDAYIRNYQTTGHARVIGIGREVTGLRKDGTLVPIELAVAPAKSKGRQIYVGTLRDLTASKQAEQERLQVKAIFDQSPDLIATAKLNEEVLFMNESGMALLGWEAAEGHKISDAHPEWAYREVREVGIPTALMNGTWTGSSAVLGSDGSEIPVSQVIVVHRNGRGEPEFASTVMRDLRREKEAETRLRAAVEAAEEGSRTKAEFLATMSHEIRTPLNGVIGMADLLVQLNLNPEAREMAETIRSSGESLLTLLNDILDFSKIEAGKVTLEARPFAVIQETRRAVRLFESMAQSKNVNLEVEIGDGVPEHIVGDLVRYKQILTNLVSNAIKFTEAGRVIVRLEHRLALGTLELEVQDSGIGMSEDQIARLGRAFTQADASTTRRFGGSGLGLSIMKGLVELMRGRWEVESEPGRGSVFRVVMPAIAGSADSLPAVSPQNGPVRRVGRVLVAEDNAVNRRLVELVLRSVADEVVMVEDGKAAVEALIARNFDVVLMDGQMPIMDGQEATRLLRQIEAREGRPRTPVIALTANALPGDREAFLECGMDGFLTKPLRAFELYTTLEQVLGPARPRSSPAEPNLA